MNKEHSIARHNDKMCFLRICRYHITLIGNNKEFPQKLDAFCFNYQHVDCLYTLFKYQFSSKIVFSDRKLFDNVQRPNDFNHQHRGVRRTHSNAEKRLLKKKYKKHLLNSFQKTKSTRTSRSVFADRIQQIKKTEVELELIKSVDCSLGGHGIYTSNLVSFKIKSL